MQECAAVQPRSFLLGAFGDPGHAFPMLALGAELARRGHAVTYQTWERWREPVTAAGMRFEAAPEYRVFPTREHPLKPYEAAVRAARETLPLLTATRYDAVVADILTVAPALAAEMAGVPWATLVPHVHPHAAAGHPAYAIGARLPRTRAGRRFWAALDRRLVARGLEQGRGELNATRSRLGLPPQPWVHNGISRDLALLATFPHLEYPRAWPPWLRIVGPLQWEPPSDDVAIPAGEGPLVVVAPSTAQDAEHRLLRAALAGLDGEPVRVLATWNGRAPDPPLGPVPANATVLPWLKYSQVMAHADVVVMHAGHGTLMRALTAGSVPVAVPAAGDMNENAARLDWAGAGVRLPRRYARPWAIRLAVRRALAEPSLRARARELAAWAARHDAAATAAGELERWVGGRVPGRPDPPAGPPPAVVR